MFTEKAKRKQKSGKKSLIRSILIMLMISPFAFFALHPAFGQSLLADGIALSVMICASVYILHQAILWLIATMLQIPAETPNADTPENL